MQRQLIRNAALEGRLVDIAIDAGRIVEIGPGLAGEELIDARGGAVFPGLHDHHAHLLATAASLRSIQLDRCTNASQVEQALREAHAAAPVGEWVRATGYHEHMAGSLDRVELDKLVPDRPLRVQHQTGSLWMLNSAGLARIGTDDLPEGAERDASGAPTGRLFRCDSWLSAMIGRTPPDLAALGRRLAALGITGVADASASNDGSSAALLGDAVRNGLLPVRLMMMSAASLETPEDGAFTVGPVKILLDDDRLPGIDDLVAIIREARRSDRNVAAHCVTAGELAMMMAALEEAGSRPGDRIEHGSVIPAEAISSLAALGLTVVTQPGFIATRGDRYQALVDPAEQQDLYRCSSLIQAGIAVAGSSDAPYGSLDPWRAISAAVTRRTVGGQVLNDAERVSFPRALDLFLPPLQHAGGAPRRLVPDAEADICILHEPLQNLGNFLDASIVAATLCAGRLAFRA